MKKININHIFYGREEEIKRIETFMNEDKADTLFIKGRRRVGKSFILDEISSKKKYKSKIVSYLGTKQKIEKELFDFLYRIETTFNLVEVTSSVAYKDAKEISADIFFQRIIEICKKKKTSIVLFIDEIQWIGKDNGAFFSVKLKEYWVALKKINKIKIVISGSSYKFFQEYVDKTESILRSISSQDTMIIQPFTPNEMKKYFFPEKLFKHHDVFLLYMMTGGVSQYLDWLKDKDQGFEYCVNSSFFKKNNVFKNEVRELLKMDLTDNKITTGHFIFEALRNNELKFESLYQKIKEKHEVSESTIQRLLNELIAMDLIACKTKDGRMIENPQIVEETNKNYYISDLFLLFYFSVVYPQQNIIDHNDDTNIFGTLLDSKKNPLESPEKDFKIPVISEFTGRAFELVVIKLLNQKNLSLPIFKKLKISDTNFNIDSYSVSLKDQMDAVILYNTYSSIKVIECKWIASFSKNAKEYANEVKTKNFHNDFKDKNRQNYYLFSIPVQTRMKKTMNKNDVNVLYYKDFFED